MALTCGFFNSLSGDRKYNAEQMSAIFDGVINNGVFQSVGNQLKTIPGTGMQVLVQSGKAWLSHVWVVNDENYPLPIQAADTQPRIDVIKLEVNHNTAARNAALSVVKGTPASAPVAPSVPASTATPIAAFPLAYVRVNAGAKSITATDITINVGTTTLVPFVTGIMQVQNIASLYAGWQNTFTTSLAGWGSTVTTDLASWKNQFDTWFSHMQTVLSETVVTNLQNQINTNKNTLSSLQTTTANTYLRKDAKASAAEVTAKTNNDKYVTPLSLANLSVNKITIGGTTYTIVDAVEG